jgi:hypothetical protein
MGTLSSSLVKQRVASIRDVEEALARQVLYGGDLITNLLELAAVSESKLVELLGESYGLEPGPAGALPVAPDSTRRLVPGELALRHGFYPLAEQEAGLVLAVSEPLSAEVLDDLEFALGARVVQRATTLVRIRQAIMRDYGLAPDRRTLRLIAKLEGLPDPSPSSLPPRLREKDARPTLTKPPSFADIEHAGARLRPGARRDSVPEAALAPAKPASVPPTRPVTAERPAAAPPPPRVRATDVAAPPGVSKTQRPPAERPRRIGPYTLSTAEKDLLDATTPEAVRVAFFDFASQFFVYSALFAISGDLAEGRDAAGPGTDAVAIGAVGVPLDLPSALSAVRDAPVAQLVRLSEEGIDAALARDLNRVSGRSVLLLPVTVRGRCVLVLYGDHGDADVELSRVGEVIAFAPLVAHAIERIILQRKGRSAARPTPAPPRRPSTKTKAPSKQERARALASALSVPPKPAQDDAPKTQPPKPSAPQASAAPEKPARGRSEPQLAASRAVIPIQPGPARPPPKPSSTPAFPLTRISTAPRVQDEPPEEEWDSATPVTHGFPATGLAPARTPSLPDLAPEPGSEPPPESEPLSTSSFDDEWPNSVRQVPLAAPSRSEAFAPQRPRRRQSSHERQLPTVIVDFAGDYKLLVDRVLAGDDEAIRKVADLGEPIVSMLVASFPGPTSSEPLRGLGDQPTRASDCGPLLRALALIGPRAAPFVVVRTADADPKVRSWATRLLGELHSAESVHALARRFVDEDPEVRRAASAAARMVQNDPKLAGALREAVLRLAADEHLPVRHAALEALAEIRDGAVVPDLVMMMQEPSPEIVRSAHWALVVITRHDFGNDAKSWGEWWRQNSSRHRIEWLIDSLMHENVELRRAAGEELKSVTKEYFGYYEDLPPKERARAQQRYRDWWDTKGKARFR